MRTKPAKPTALKKLEGNRGHRPLNPCEPTPPPPKPEDLLCPKHLTGVARETWNEVVPALVPLGLFTALDRQAMTVYCLTRQRFHQAHDELEKQSLIKRSARGRQIVNPLLRVVDQAARQLARMGAEFGLSPSARSPMIARGLLEKKKPNRFLKLVKRNDP